MRKRHSCASPRGEKSATFLFGADPGLELLPPAFLNADDSHIATRCCHFSEESATTLNTNYKPEGKTEAIINISAFRKGFCAVSTVTAMAGTTSIVTVLLLINYCWEALRWEAHSC